MNGEKTFKKGEIPNDQKHTICPAVITTVAIGGVSRINNLCSSQVKELIRKALTSRDMGMISTESEC
ncbi:MAG: hypothetical protein ACFWUC_12040 [Oscillospiraceae bacterium]|jgi:hypothetical protein